MSRFRQTRKGVPTLSTASLPDIVFMLLFFFMVSTAMRQYSLKVKLQLPQASEVKKLERKSLITHIYIGSPMQGYEKKYGTEPRIQLNDAFANVSDIQGYVAAERNEMSESERNLMTVALKVDENAQMGIVTDVKQELRQANALKIHYSALHAAK